MTTPDPTSDLRPPRAIGRVVVLALAALLAGSGYIVAVRGEAILVDLSGLARGMWCF